MSSSGSEVTRLLEAIEDGDAAASDELLPIVYGELRKLARARMARERPGATFQPTELVHEAYLRLLGSDDRWHGRAHFFAAAAEAMRRILIERARRAARLRHGGGRRRVDLQPSDRIAETDLEEILAVDRALDRLADEDPTCALVVKLRTFAGLTVPETAHAVGISTSSVDRLWRSGRAWLASELV